jgi:flagellar protein FliL
VKGKLKFVLAVPILLAVVAAAYMFVLAPKKAAAKPKVNGTLVQLSEDFVVNLAGGHYGKVSIALLLSSAPPAGSGGTVTLPQESAVRSVITDELTGLEPAQLVDRGARHELLARLLKVLKRSTDEPVTEVLITDLAVQ